MDDVHRRRVSDTISDLVTAQMWLDPVADTLQPLVHRGLDAAGVHGRNALHGTWLGHPLHPALTDVPIGAWTLALVLDLADAAGAEGARAGADAAVAVGLAGAVAAAVTGAADWSQTNGEARRVGVAHAATNVAATLLYAASMVMRRGGSRRGARLTAAAGYGAAMAGAFLGGHLVFAHQIGVDHTATPDAGKPRDFVPVLAERELAHEPKRVEAEGVAIMLVRSGGEIRALANTCPHMGGPLAEGRIENGTIRCPWHGSRFDLRTGAAVEGPTAFPAPCFEVRVRDGRIEVRARQHGG